MLGQREHVGRNGEVGQVAEVIFRLAHLIAAMAAFAKSWRRE
jgi:hypothetical protein